MPSYPTHSMVWRGASARDALVGSSNTPAVACSCGEWRGPSDLLDNRAGREAANGLWAAHLLKRLNHLEALMSEEEELV